MKIATLGPEGTFSHEAVIKYKRKSTKSSLVYELAIAFTLCLSLDNAARIIIPIPDVKFKA